MKKIGIVILVLLLMIGAGAYLFLGNLDGLVESTIEEVGTELAGSEVALDDVQLDLASGSASLLGLTIANPEGYSSDHALALKRVTVAIDPASLAKPVLRLNEVVVRGARLNVEQQGNRSNLSDLLDQLQKDDNAAGEGTESAGDSTDVRLFLKRFVFANTRATLLSEESGKQVIKVPDVKRNNVGDPEQGLSPEQLGDALLEAVLEEVEAAVAEHLAQAAGNALKNKLMEKMGLQDEE